MSLLELTKNHNHIDDIHSVDGFFDGTIYAANLVVGNPPIFSGNISADNITITSLTTPGYIKNDDRKIRGRVYIFDEMN